MFQETSIEMKWEAWDAGEWFNGNNKKISNWKTSILNTLKYMQEKTDPNEKKSKFRQNLEVLNKLGSTQGGF